MTDTVLAPVDVRPRSPIEFRSTGDLAVDWTERMITSSPCPTTRTPRLSSTAGRSPNRAPRARSTVSNGEPTGSRSTGTTTTCAPSAGPSPCTRHAPKGWSTELRIAKTSLGDETLALADDHSLEASVGFAVLPGGERWLEGRNRRRLERIFLDHIAMVPEGAYDAQVLDVRTAAAPVERVGDTEPGRSASPGSVVDNRKRAVRCLSLRACSTL